MISPLIDNMMTQYGYPLLDRDTFADFIDSQEECVLFFCENPSRFPESNDVAMILPELVKEYAYRFTTAVIGPDIQKELQGRYGFNEWPTLVFLRRGEYLGQISRVQDWMDYLARINDILSSEPSRAPGINVAVEQPAQTARLS